MVLHYGMDLHKYSALFLCFLNVAQHAMGDTRRSSVYNPETSFFSQNQGNLREYLLTPGGGANAPLGELGAFTYDNGALPAVPAYYGADYITSRGWSPPPNSTANATLYIGIGVNGITAVDMTRRLVSFSMDLTMRWEDHRLRWSNNSNNATVTSLFADGNNITRSDVFVPEVIQLHSPFKSGIPSAISSGIHDGFTTPGAVSISRNGTATFRRKIVSTVKCDFELSKFPFDDPVCSSLLLPYSLSSKYVRLVLDQSLATQVKITGGIYKNGEALGGDLDVASVDCHVVNEPAPGGVTTQAGDWQAVKLTINLQRSTGVYWSLVLVPSLLLPLFSFSLFWCNPASGERLVYSSCSLLIAVLIASAVTALLPVAGSDAMIILQCLQLYFKFQIAVVLQSSVVVLCFNQSEPNLLPSCITSVFTGALSAVGLLESWKLATEERKLMAAVASSEAADAEAAPQGGNPKEEALNSLLIDTIDESTVHMELNELSRPSTAREDLGGDPDSPSLALDSHDISHKVLSKKGETLDGWLRRIGYEAYEAKFRKNGMQTLAQVAECRLTESDLETELGVESILLKRRLMAHIMKLTGQEEFENDNIGGIVSQLRLGLTGDANTGVRIGKLKNRSKATLVNKNAPAGFIIQDPQEIESQRLWNAKKASQSNRELAAILKKKKRVAVHAYYARIGGWVDQFSQIIFPVAFAISFGVILAGA